MFPLASKSTLTIIKSKQLGEQRRFVRKTDNVQTFRFCRGPTSDPNPLFVNKSYRSTLQTQFSRNYACETL